jgi:predicted nucleic acid-binding protein
MKSVIFDATPLIYLTRIGLLGLIEAIPARKFVAGSVYAEVVERGKAKGFADAVALERLFAGNAIVIAKPSDKRLLRALSGIRGLEKPEAETLATAKERGYRVVVDDLQARRVARSYGIDYVGTPHLLVLGMRNRILTKQEAVEALDRIIEAGWRCGPEVYREIVQRIRES